MSENNINSNSVNLLYSSNPSIKNSKIKNESINIIHLLPFFIFTNLEISKTIIGKNIPVIEPIITPISSSAITY